MSEFKECSECGGYYFVRAYVINNQTGYFTPDKDGHFICVRCGKDWQYVRDDNKPNPLQD